MVAMLEHCTFNLNTRAASIDTPLHAFVPAIHVDHMHPDALIAIAASENSERLTEEAFGGELGFLPWQRPGFDLGLKLGAVGGGEPAARRCGARRSRPVHLGRHRQVVLRDDAQDARQGVGLACRPVPQAGVPGCPLRAAAGRTGAPRLLAH